MKVRDLVIVAAFVLGGVAVAYGGDVMKALRDWKYTSPLCLRVEEAWANATGATLTQLQVELASKQRQLAVIEEEVRSLRQSLDGAVKDVGDAHMHIAKLVTDIEHLERIRETQSGELNHCRQLIDAQEAVVKETNWRYQQLASRVRELGQEGAVSVLVRE
jgi:chromosome segregation ATPase